MADRNGATTTRAKRKQKQPPEAEERPVKQHKISNGTRSNGAVKGDLNQNITTEGPPQKTSRTLNGTDSIEVIKPKISPDIMSVGHEMNGLARVAAVVGTTADAEWQKTIESVVCNVVSIRFCQTCAFDTDPALASEATGFVVDAERGYVCILSNRVYCANFTRYIMTNRHVVGSGPFWGYCIFDNHEEVDVYPVYRDPVHDFGILRFDPKAIKYMEVAALTLRPDLAKVGSEIRVVGM